MATPASGLHSLATIIKRLEAATSRIEDIVSTQGTLSTQAPASTNAKQAEGPSSAPPPPPPTPPPLVTVVQETPKTVAAFDEQVIQGKVKAFVELSNEFGSTSLTELAGLYKKQYEAQRSFLLVAAACQKPEQEILGELIGELYSTIGAVSKAKESHRKDREWYTHLTLISEAGPALGWVESPKPASHIGQFKESVEYYANKLIQEFKAKSANHVVWAKSFTAILTELDKYVKEYHPTGLVWNAKGVPYDQYKVSSSGGAAPPPPPPPPVPAKDSTLAPVGGAAAVFADLNKGEDITKTLRKVDKSEMTHKNPSLRAGSVVPASTSSPSAKKPIKPTKPSALAGKKSPKFVLDINKWLIEYQENETLTVENAEINQSINIFGCKNTTIIIKRKVNAVSIFNSIKTSVLVESVVSSVSVTSSPSFTLQITGTAPMIQIDSTDSGQIYLSKASLKAEITTAKCSAINVSLPVEGEEDGVFEEQPIPEMLRTVVKDGKLVTTTVEHTG